MKNGNEPNPGNVTEEKEADMKSYAMTVKWL